MSQADAMTSAATGLRSAEVLRAIDVLAVEGHVDEAIDLLQRALTEVALPQATAAVLRLRLSSMLFMTDRAGEAVAEAESVLAQAHLPEDLYGAAELSCLLALVEEGDVERARDHAQTVLGGGAPGSDVGLAGAFSALAVMAKDEGRLGDALALRQAAVERADRLPVEARRHQHPRLGLIDDLMALGRFDEARRAMVLVRSDIERTGDPAWAAATSIAGARLHLAAGRLVDARAEAAAALSTAETLGARIFAALAHMVLASVALVAGDLPLAERHLGLAHPRQRPTWVEVRLAVARWGPGRAADLIGALCDRLVADLRLLVDEPGAAAWLVRATLAVGDRRRAEAVAACAERLAICNPDLPSLAAVASHARGVLRADVEALGDAAAGHRDPWARASAHEDAGVALADVGRQADGRSALDDALAIYAQMGADRDHARVCQRLSDLRRRRGGHHAVVVSGWASLTDSERRVAHVVAGGLTNANAAERLHLSRYTIDFHLRQIFRKLDIRSRVGLTRIVVDHSA